MEERIVRFLGVTRALLAYMDEEYVFDKLADAGCGGADPHRSERFDELIKEVRRGLEELEAEALETEGEV